MYDLRDKIVSYFDNIYEISDKLGYPVKELNRKYRNSENDSINLVINNTYYKIFCFK